MNCCSDDKEPQQISYSETLADQLAAQEKFAPRALSLYQQFQPEYLAEDLDLAQSALFGTPGGQREQTYWEDVPASETITGYNVPGAGFMTEDQVLQRYGGVIPPHAQPVKSVTPASQVQKSRMVDQAGSPGLISILQRAQPELDALQAGSTSRQRASELSDIQKYGPGFRTALQDINPEQTALRNRLYGRVSDDLERGGLSPFESHSLQQGYRTASRGRVGNTGDTGAAMEAYYLAANARERELENRRQAMGLIGLDQSLYGDPFLQITGRQSGSVPLAQSLLGQGQQTNAAAGPRLFVPESQNAFDIAGFNANAQNAAAIASANNSAALGGALIGGLGSLGGGLLRGAGAAAAGGGSLFSGLFGKR